MYKNILGVIYIFLFTNSFLLSNSAFSQTPAVSITTFKNDAAGAYNIIHDDFGDYGVIGINNYVDTMTFNRNIKITFGAITSSCESNPGMYTKAKQMIDVHHHEIINHSHTHSCAIVSDACGGTGPNYEWAVPGATDRLNIEVDQSTQSILTNTGVQPRFFIYPYDQFNANSNSYLQSKGFIGSRTGNYNAASPNNFTPNAAGFFQTALVVDASDNGSGLVIAKNHNYWVDQAIANKQWVSRELHNVGDTGWGSTDLTTYRNHLNYVQQKMNSGQLWVGTISEILTYQIQKLNYTPTSTFNSTTKLITVNWNTPTFNVQQYLQNLQFKSPITLKVDISNAAFIGNYQITQNGVSITDYKKVGTNLLVNVYPHQGPVKIQIVDCAALCITTQPSNTTVLEGTPLTLLVQASGGTITYQWYKNGNLLNGETGSSITIANAATTDAGTYYVKVSNGTNTLNSSNATVTITPNPCLSLCITNQPQSYSTNVGTSASFSVTAQGIQPITYKWYKNNVLIPSATSSTYTIPTTVLADGGNYKVDLTNSTGTVTSNVVTLTLYNQTPFSGSPINIPGTFQAENFDNGGQNVSYFDNTTANEGDATTYRNNEVDIEVCTDGGNGYDVGYITDNEWLEYTVNVAATTNYNFLFRIASVNSGQGNGLVHLEMDGQVVASGITMPFTGSWTTYTSYTFNNVPLTSGVHVLRLFIENGDFNLNYITVTSTSPITPTITFNNVTKTYGDASFTIAATSNSSGAITYTATGTGATVSSAGVVTITGAGTVTVTASQAASSPYAAGSTSATITINKKALTITADNQAKLYNTPNPTLTVTYSGGFVGSDNVNSFTTAPVITTTALTNSSIGAYPITASGAVSNNYTFIYANGSLSVYATSPTITFANIDKTYGDPSFNFLASSNSAGAITYTATGTGATVTPAGLVTIAGTGTVTVTAYQISDGNYTSKTVTATITIAKKAVTVTSEDKTKAFNTVNPALTIVYSGLAYNETASNLTTQATATTTALTNSPAGTYPITPAGASSPNYTFTYVNGTLTVSSAIIPTINFTNVSKTYGDASFSMTANSDSPGAITYSIISGTAATITTAGVVTILGAGNVTVKASQEASGSYAANSANATLTINKKVLTITAENKTKVYNTANPTLTVVYSGFVYNETESNLTTQSGAISSAVTNSPVGSYPITPSGAASANYTFNYVNGTLTVTATTPTINFANLTQTYGDASITVGATSNSQGSITYSIISGTAASITTDGIVTILGTGTVTIKASQVANGSYIASTKNATLTINPKSITVSADNKTKPYGQTNPSLTVSYSGFAYNETSSNLTTLPIASTIAVTNSNIGDYAITVTGAQSSNYTFNYVNGVLTVLASDATALSSFSNSNTGKEGSVINLNVISPSGGTVTYSVDNSTGTASISGNQLTLISQGTVTVTATIAASGNYDEVVISQQITITPLTSIDNELIGVSDWKFYPIPANQILSFQITLNQSSLVTIELVEVETGRIMNTYKMNFSSGDQMMQIPVDHLEEGIYIAKIYLNNQMAYRKISIVK